MKFTVFVRIILILVLCFIVSLGYAQCAMCKQIVDSGSKNGSTVAKGLNMGILYLLVVPFLAVGTVSFAFWRRWKESQK